MRYLADLEIISTIPHQHGKVMQPAVRAPRWIPPPAGMVKFNVDGGIAKHRRKGAVAAVCQDDQGGCLGSSARVIEECMDPGTLEAMACSEALALTADLNLQKLIIACDAAQVINHINEGSKGIYSLILQEI